MMLECPISLGTTYDIPWHEYNIHEHLSWCPILGETTLTLFTKDHQKVVKLKDNDYPELSRDEQNNWTLNRRDEWQKELKTLYKNRGD